MSKWSLFSEIPSQSQERQFFNLKVMYIKRQIKTCLWRQFFLLVHWTHSTLRFVKLQSKEDTLYLPSSANSPDYCGVRKRVSSYQNLLDLWGRKRTNPFLILLDCLIEEQSYLRPIVFDHVCLIRSNLICRRRALVRFWWWQTHVCWWTQMLDTTTAPHIRSKFIDTSNIQICGVCAEHPSLDWPWIHHHLLFVFGSVEIAQKDMCCVQE